jgi:hypothetical protein
MGVPEGNDPKGIEEGFPGFRRKAQLEEKEDNTEEHQGPDHKGWVSPWDVVLEGKHFSWI